ncbi:MAG: hypothetical protein ACI9MR_004598 [Myxococcota bacterium]|jgi:hypothetical protein
MRPTVSEAARLSLALLIGVSAVAGLASETHAQMTEKVLGMRIEGEGLSNKDKGDLFSVLQSKLELYANKTLVQPPASELFDEMLDLECFDIDVSCLARLGVKYGADKVFYAQVDKKDTGLRLLVRVADAKTAKLIRDKFTSVPNAAGLAAALESEIEAVLGKLPKVVVPVIKPPVPVGAKPGLVVVDTNVPNAAITIDGEYAGTGTATVSRLPGKYTVRVAYQGYDEQIFEVEVAAGGTSTRNIALVETVTTPVVIPKKPGDKVDDDGDNGWILWALLGAAVVGGTVAAIALTSGEDEAGPTAPVILSIDGNNAWRDAAVRGGRP